MLRQIIAGIMLIVTALTAVPADENKYADIENTVEAYLSEAYDMEGEITNTSFQQYDYGITGGMFMYSFEFTSTDRKVITISYMSYADISEDTLDMLRINQ